MKGEPVFREILEKVFEEKAYHFNVRSLSEATGVPSSTVSHSLRPLKEMGAIDISRKGINIKNPKKILLFWCSIRRLEPQVVYRKSLQMPVQEIEGMVPPEAIFTAFTAFKLRFGYVPADYSEVYVYGDAGQFISRFGEPSPPKERCNLIVMEPDMHLKKLGRATLAQIYVDLWNIPAWYAQEFINELDRMT
ncbi:MAG: ArsR family transcriptional regulator [Candidatus Methanosuratincola petrocarbonis]|nr:ArsR family transcriptional regulator [Candidatus Methanosuratincola sp.]